MENVIAYNLPEGRLFRVDAEAVGLSIADIERRFRAIGREPSWPVQASTAVGALNLDSELVAAACEHAERRIETAREALHAPIDAARLKIAEHEARERQEARLAEGARAELVALKAKRA